MTKKTINILTISMASGGAEKTISLLLPHLAKDYKVNLILFYDAWHFDIPPQITTFILKPKEANKEKSYLYKIFSIFSLLYHYFIIVRITKPDVTISFLTRPNILNSLIRYKNSKRILSERCYPSIAYKSNRLRYSIYKILLPLVYNLSDELFSNSIKINQDLRDNFGVRIPMTVIYNPVEPVGTRVSATNINRSDIIWIGRFIPIKNPGLLIQAAKLCTTTPSLRFLGQGTLYHEIRSIVGNHPVYFEGVVKNVYEYILQSKILALTSNSEGFPNVILESLACNVPVIATNCLSGPLELLNENDPVEIPQGSFFEAKYGILVNVGDVIGFSNAIDFLLSNPEKLKYYSIKGKERSTHFQPLNIYNRLMQLIENSDGQNPKLCVK